MKKGMAALGAVLLVVGLVMNWVGDRLGGMDRATVHLFGHTMEFVAPGVFFQSGGNHAVSYETVAEDVSTPAAVGGSFEGSWSPFSSIIIDVDIGDVFIVGSDYYVDDYMVSVNYWGTNYTVCAENADDGTLVIWSESGAVPVGCGSSITVYVPAGAVLELIDVALDLGSVTLDGVTAQDVCLDLDLGDVVGTELTVLDQLSVYADLGSVELVGDLGGWVDVNADLGEVALCLYRPASDYRWDLSADLGSISVDGLKAGGGNISSSVTGGKGSEQLCVYAGLGSITVDFDCAPVAYVTEDSGLMMIDGVYFFNAVQEEAVPTCMPFDEYTMDMRISR